MSKSAICRGVISLMVWAVVALYVADRNSSHVVIHALVTATSGVVGLVLWLILTRRDPPDAAFGPKEDAFERLDR